MTTPEIDFTIIARAGLTQKEFAVLSGVSRVTANLWVMGKMNPHRYIKARTAKVVSTLETAVETGALPLPDSVPSLERGRAIKAAFRAAYDVATA
jgi:transcriptional regulator with XRE-family HTH domain